MKSAQTELKQPSRGRTLSSRAHRKTLDAIFRHPVAHSLGRKDVVSLMREIGDVEAGTGGEFEFRVNAERHVLRKAHSKDLSGDEVSTLRHFLQRAGWSEHGETQSTARPAKDAGDLLVVLDYHGATIYDIDVSFAAQSKHTIAPYDPHLFLHHLTHKDQTREHGQRAPDAPAFFEEIAAGLRTGKRIVVIGHGSGKSNAAHRLVAYLRDAGHDVFQHIVAEVVADLSELTQPQLLEMAREALA